MKLKAKIVFHRAYQAGIILKGLDGVLEVAGGITLFMTTQPAIQRAIAFLTRKELIEDPSDFIASHVVRMAQQMSLGSRHFAGIYLLVHGLIKIGLVAGLWRGLRWSYPVALLLLTALIFYQLYRLSHTLSLPLCFLTVVDCAIVILIWREWRGVKGH